MKKKALKSLLLVIFAVVCILAVSSCGGGDDTTTTQAHTHVYDREVVSAEHLHAVATCTEGAIYRKSCECGVSSPEYTFVGSDPLGHDYGSFVSDGNGTHKKVCQNDSTHVISERCTGGTANCQSKAICDTCHGEYGALDPNVHTPTTYWIQEENAHYHECVYGCSGAKIDEAWCTGGTADCSNRAICEVCNLPYGEFDENVHNPSDEWLSRIDGTHIKQCQSCFDIVEQQECRYTEATCVDRPTCIDCGGVSGYVNSENHTMSSEWIKTATTHKRVFPCCGEAYIEETAHTWEDGVCTWCNYGCTHTGGTATCTDKACCELCQELYGELDPDNHSGSGEWITTATTHKFHQGCCNTDTIPETDHSWVDGVCEDCDYVCQHTGGNATCMESPVCEICSEHYGLPDENAHTEELEWVTTETTHEKKYPCCGTVVITEKLHSWNNGVCEDCEYACEHTGGNATCSSGPVCDNCGSVYGEADNSAHVYEGNECTVCHHLTVSQGLIFASYQEYPSRNQYYMVTERGTCTDKNIVLPTTYNGVQVKKIDSGAFREDELLESITVNGTYDSISLSECPNLEKIIINGYVKSVSVSYCHALTEVEFGEEATVETVSFIGCTGLRSIDFSGTGLKKIGNSGFAHCLALTDINLGEDLEEIGDNAFLNCYGLYRIVLPASLTKITGADNSLYKSFRYCERLIEVENHSALELTKDDFNSYTCIYNPDNGEESEIVVDNGFAYNKNAPSELLFFVDIHREGRVEVPAQFTTLRCGSTFAYCRGLTEIVIPKTVTSMAYTCMFQGCTSLESIDIPFIGGTVTAKEATFAFVGMFSTARFSTDLQNIGNKLLYEGCVEVDNHGDTSSANRHYVPASLKKVTVQDGNLFYCGAFRGCSMIEEIVFVKMNTVSIPTGSVYIRNDATMCIPTKCFYGCTSLKSITLPEDGSCVQIYGDAFEGCSSLTSLIIPEGVRIINGAISQTCVSLVHVTLPSTLESGNYAYNGSRDAFMYLPSLVQVCNNSAAYTDASFPNAINIYSDNEGENKLMLGDDGSLYLVDGDEKTLIKYLGNNKEVVLDSNVTAIAPGAFRDSGVTSIVIPEGVTAIEDYTFYGSALETIELPSTLETIGQYAFTNTFITEIDLSTVTSIGAHAFEGTTLESVILGDELITIGEYAFAETAVTEVIIPTSVTSIGQYAFYGCSSLEKISLPFVGRYADSSLAANYRETSLVHIFGYNNLDIPTSLKTIEFNCSYIKAWMLDGTQITNVIIGARAETIEACSFINNTVTVTSISFAEPADWIASDGTTTITATQCNDGTTALYQFNQASTKYDYNWTKAVAE